METIPQSGIDLGVFEGTWINTESHPQWLQQLKLFPYQGGWCLSGVAVSVPEILPPIGIVTYMDNMNYLAFLARYTLDDRQVVLAANTQKGLIVVTSLHRLGSGAHHDNQMYREFLYRDLKRGN